MFFPVQGHFYHYMIDYAVSWILFFNFYFAINSVVEDDEQFIINQK